MSPDRMDSQKNKRSVLASKLTTAPNNPSLNQRQANKQQKQQDIGVKAMTNSNKKVLKKKQKINK